MQYTVHIPSLDCCCVNNIGGNPRETEIISVVKSLVDGCICDETCSAKLFKRKFEKKEKEKKNKDKD